VLDAALSEKPTDYFSAALARVADVLEVHLNYGYIPKSIRHEPLRHWASLDPDPFGDTQVWAGSDREALVALWLAVLQAACEKECPSATMPSHYVSRTYAMKDAQAVIDALVGGDTND